MLRAIVLALASAFSLVVSAAAPLNEVFRDDFSDGAKPQWSHREVQTAPGTGQKFLGEFGQHVVTLSLKDLPPHKLVKLSFDVVALRSWDGNSPQYGPDPITVVTGDGRTVFRSTFGNTNTQSFPGVFGVHTAPAGAGSTSRNTLGYLFNSTPVDGVYRVDFAFPSDTPELLLRFIGQIDSSIDDESWGLANVTVHLAASEEKLDDVAATLAELRSEDPAVATAAMYRLACAREQALPALRELTAGKSLPANSAWFSPFVAEVGSGLADVNRMSLADAEQRQLALAAIAMQMAGAPQGSVARADEATSNCRVRVVDEKTGEPLPFVTVKPVSAGYSAVVHTNAEGIASVAYPADANQYFGLNLVAHGYMSLMVYYEKRSTEPVPPEIVLKASKGVTVGGRVVDDTGAPAAGATVMVALSQRSESPRTIVGANWVPVTTDADGRWTMDNTPERPTSASIGVYHHRYASTFSNSAGSYAMNEVKDFDALQKQTMVHTLKRGVLLEGQVIGKDGKPLAGAGVGVGDDRVASNILPEVKTDAEGRFAIGVHPEGSVTVTIRAAGHSPEMLSVTPGGEPLKIEMKSGKSIAGRVVDKDGKGIPQAYIWVDTWRGKRTITTNLRADGEGRFSWNDAPADGANADVQGTGFARVNKAVLKPGADNIITLTPPAKITGQVVDAETGEPVDKFELIPGIRWENQPQPHWQRDQTKDIARADGTFEITFTYPYPGHQLRIEAPGYLPQETPVFKLPDGSQHFVLKMQRGEPVAGTVVTPDGEPASAARAYLVLPGGQFQMTNGDVSRYAQRDQILSKAGDDGRFTFAPQTGDFTVVVLHPFGYAQVNAKALAESQKVQLQSWATIRGKMMNGTRPAAGVDVRGHFQDGRMTADAPRIFNSLEATTADDGTFEFKWVTPGTWSIAKGIRQGTSVMYASQQPVKAEPGGEYTVKIGGTGRPVVGRFTLPEQLKDRADWQASFPRIEAIVPPLEVKPITPPKDLKPEELNAWYQEYLKSDEGKEYAAKIEAHNKLRRSYPVVVERDGRFRADEVEAGKYRLGITLMKSSGPFTRGDEPMLAQGSTEFTVGEIEGGVSDEAMELPTFALTFLPPCAAGDLTPEFEVPAADGELLSPSAHRGKVLLLHAWAPDDASLPMVKAARELHPNVVFLGFPMTVQPGMPFDLEAQSAKHGIDWPQAAPTSFGASPFATQYQVRRFPTLILIGKDGKILARDFPADQLDAKLDEAEPKRAKKRAGGPMSTAGSRVVRSNQDPLQWRIRLLAFHVLRIDHLLLAGAAIPGVMAGVAGMLPIQLARAAVLVPVAFQVALHIREFAVGILRA